jgi:hypothetical protein
MSLQVASEHNAQCENQGFVNRGCSGTSYMAVLQQLGVQYKGCAQELSTTFLQMVLLSKKQMPENIDRGWCSTN